MKKLLKAVGLSVLGAGTFLVSIQPSVNPKAAFGQKNSGILDQISFAQKAEAHPECQCKIYSVTVEGGGGAVCVDSGCSEHVSCFTDGVGAFFFEEDWCE